VGRLQRSSGGMQVRLSFEEAEKLTRCAIVKKKPEPIQLLCSPNCLNAKANPNQDCINSNFPTKNSQSGSYAQQDLPESQSPLPYSDISIETFPSLLKSQAVSHFLIHTFPTSLFTAGLLQILSNHANRFGYLSISSSAMPGKCGPLTHDQAPPISAMEYFPTLGPTRYSRGEVRRPVGRRTSLRAGFRAR